MKKETEARLIRKETVLDKADQVQLFKKHGYSIDNLMKDIRFRVNAALTEANLQGTTYGKQVLKGLPPSNAQNYVYKTSALKSNIGGIL